ncbi:MAG: acetyl-CoA carboxylase biotin carboxyl carrier protein subunit [Lachnospiraceae bacterium]|nr:acetyl-CoA carboxylase biotin carboxyl carrier protein subunit [Lachnospiraceae bacterium]
MKEYIITVNGKNYDVMVEERGGGSIVTTATTPQPAAAAPAADASGDAGSIKIEAGAAGKVFRVEAPVGTQVKKGQTVVVLEVMKMETPVVAPKDGVIVSIEVSEGQAVESGALLATMN